MNDILAKALTKQEGPNICWDARFRHVFFWILISCLLQKNTCKKRASHQTFGPSYFDRALEHDKNSVRYCFNFSFPSLLCFFKLTGSLAVCKILNLLKQESEMEKIMVSHSFRCRDIARHDPSFQVPPVQPRLFCFDFFYYDGNFSPSNVWLFQFSLKFIVFLLRIRENFLDFDVLS